MIERKAHKKCIIQVGAKTLRDILNSVGESVSPSRKEISDKTSYTQVTVGKVFDAVCALSLASKEIRKPSHGGRVCAHLNYSDDINLLVIDLSSRYFCMSVMSLSLKVRHRFSYTYSDVLRYEENLLKFLTFGLQEMKNHISDISACVLIAENADRVCRHDTYAYMPLAASNIPQIKKLISDVLGFPPDITVSPEIAIKQYLMSIEGGADSGYILIGNTLSMCYLSRVGNISVCNPWDLIVDGKPLWKYISTSCEIDVIYTAAAKLVNTLDCAFSPRHIYLQSDSYALGDAFVGIVSGYLSQVCPAKSTIHICRSALPIQLTGAAVLLRKHLLRRLIVSTEGDKR